MTLKQFAAENRMFFFSLHRCMNITPRLAKAAYRCEHVGRAAKLKTENIGHLTLDLAPQK